MDGAMLDKRSTTATTPSHSEQEHEHCLPRGDTPLNPRIRASDGIVELSALVKPEEGYVESGFKYLDPNRPHIRVPAHRWRLAIARSLRPQSASRRTSLGTSQQAESTCRLDAEQQNYAKNDYLRRPSPHLSAPQINTHQVSRRNKVSSANLPRDLFTYLASPVLLHSLSAQPSPSTSPSFRRAVQSGPKPLKQRQR
ncbi:hypothetical protein HMN09_00310400 [Mycena chlorophos]|uniref:Uncharacterized protein n=1 Tax=Mycena chlorophos TaxID=658473 RepID=A0A8H6WID7_MYCCL|nr:hypothetical protein HMN09_00310400 [Mycena chlorophos]